MGALRQRANIFLRERVTTESKLESLIPSPSLYLATERDLKNFLVLPQYKWVTSKRHLYTERLAPAIVELKLVFVANSSVILSPKEGTRGLAYMAGVVLGFVGPRKQSQNSSLLDELTLMQRTSGV